MTSVALLCVLLAYSLANDMNPFYFFQFADEAPSNLKPLYIAMVLGVVVANDLASVLQTAMFMRFATSIRSFADMLFLGFCDLIITINIFVFIFPLAMAGIFRIDDTAGRNIEIYASASTLMNMREPAKKDPSSLPLDEFERDDDDVPFVHDETFAKEFNKLARESRSRLDEIFIEPYLLHGVGEEKYLIRSSFFVASKGMKLDKINKIIWDQLGVTLDNSQPPKSETRLQDDLRKGESFSHGTVYLRDGFRTTSNLSLYYAAYTESHVVQDQFLGLLSLRPIFQPIKNLIFRFPASQMEVPHENAKEFIFSCDNKVTFLDTLPDRIKCNSYALAYTGPALRDIYFNARLFEPPIQPVIVSAFASTGLFLAFLFYASLTLYVISAMILKAALGIGVGHGLFDLDKNPFAVSAGILIAAFIPLGLILSQALSFFTIP